MTTPEAQTNIDIKTLEGQKATLMLVNTMGFPIVRHITITKADIVAATRYQNHMTDKKCLELKYVEKGKRKLVGTRYTEADLAVALGWQNVEVPSDFVIFEESLLANMMAQVKDIIYSQQGL